VTLYVTGLLGRVDESRFAGRRVVPVLVAWDEASRRRLRRDASDGTDVAIDLEPGGYLADGTVLDDDGERVVVVQRPPERALVIRLDDLDALSGHLQRPILGLGGWVIFLKRCKAMLR